MRVCHIEKLDDCFDGSRAYACHFDTPWTREAIGWLKVFGRLEYFGDFPRPFFRLHAANGLLVKGVQGLAHCRVVLPANGALSDVDAWCRAVEAAAPSAIDQPPRRGRGDVIRQDRAAPYRSALRRLPLT